LALLATCTAVFGSTASSAGRGSVSQRDANCDDFSSQAAAQSYFIAHGGPSSDPAGLDADHDGIACETNPCPCSTGGGGGGGGGGDGGGNPPPAPPPPKPPPVRTEKICGKFVGIHGSRVCLKTVTKADKLKRVEDFRFRGLPALCGDGSKPKFTGKDARIDGDGKRFRSRHPKVLGGFHAIQANVVGKVKDEGRKARGIVRVRSRNSAEAACNTRGRRWKAN
jgi:hypothetical protein